MALRKFWICDEYIYNMHICMCMYIYIHSISISIYIQYIYVCDTVWFWDFKAMKEKKNFRTLMGTVRGTSAKIPANELSNFAPCSTEPARCVVKGIATFRFVKRPRAFPLQDHALLGGGERPTLAHVHPHPQPPGEFFRTEKHEKTK